MGVQSPNRTLFVLRLNVPVNNFLVMWGRSQLFLGLTSIVGSCLAQGLNTVTPVGIEPKAFRFGVRRSLCTLLWLYSILLTSHLSLMIKPIYRSLK